MNHRFTLLSALIVTGLLSAETPEVRRALEERVAPIRAQLASQRSLLGLNEKHDFQVKSILSLEGNDQVVRFHQTFKGLRVWGGESLVHLDVAGNRKSQDVHVLRPFQNLDVEPALQSTEAVSKVLHRLETEAVQPGEDKEILTKSSTRWMTSPTAELLVYPILRQVRVPGTEHKAESELLAVDLQEVLDGVRLAYYVQIRREVKGKASYWDAIVDAHTGEVLKQWDALQKANVKGTGQTLYSGTVSLDVNYTGSTYQMLDTTRATSPQFSVTPNNSSTIYTNTSATFGNGSTSDTKTVAADALWGVQAAYDCLFNCFSWRGLNNANAGLNIKVHLSDDNAYFDGYNSIVFGDGISYFKPLVEVDVVAHEYGHAVCQSTANLTYSSESGGLNEANSDILGTVVEFYAAGGKTGSTIPASGGNWLLGNKVSKDGNPLRWMYKPSKDGVSPDVWSSSIGSIDVHYSSGPGNRMFYFLSMGSQASGDYSSSKLTYGPMTGIGIDKAARIWFKALTQRMTASTNYAAAYSACKWSAEQLYGAGSPEAIATQRAFAAIAVAQDVSEGQQIVSVAVTPSTASVKTGASYQFSASVTGSTNTAVTWTATGGSISSTGLYTAPSTAGTYTVKATSVADPSKSATATVTVTTTTTPISVQVTPASVSVQTNASYSFTASVSGTTNTAVTWTATGGTISSSGLYTAPATAGSYIVRATSVADPSKSATAAVTVTGGTVPAGELILNGGFESGASSWAGSTGSIGNWYTYPYYMPSYEGLNASYLGGNGSTSTETLYQTVKIPANATSAILSFYLYISTQESGSTAYDRLAVQIRNNSGSLLRTLATYSNVNASYGYQFRGFDLTAYRGQTIRIHFNMTEDSMLSTSFLVDKVSLAVK